MAPCLHIRQIEHTCFKEDKRNNQIMLSRTRIGFSNMEREEMIQDSIFVFIDLDHLLMTQLSTLEKAH